MFTFRLLGGASLEGVDGPLPGKCVQPRRIALMALLAIDPHHTVSREKLIGYLWPESDAEQGRHRLSESLYILRKELGEGVLISEGESVRLDPNRFICDAISFSEALRNGELEEAVSFYAGPFVDGFFLKNAPEFDRWAESVRSSLGEDFGRTLENLATDADRNADYLKAVEWWTRLASHDPYNTRFALGRMEALVRAGDPGNAIHFAREHAQFLMEELGTEPTPEFLAYVETFRNGDVPNQVHGGEGSAGGRRDPVSAFDGNPPSAVEEGPGRTELPTVLLRIPWRVGAGAVSLLLMLLGAAAVYTVLPRHPGSELIPDLVVVPPFENRTGDPAFDSVAFLAAEWVEGSIEQVEGVQVVPSSFARRYAVEASGDGPASRSRVVAERSKAGWLIDGVIRAVGDSLKFQAEIIELHDQRRKQNVVEAGLRDPLNSLIDRFARRVSGALAYEFDPWMGEMEKGSQPLRSPPTIEAFREHRLGYEAYNLGDGAASFRHHMAAFDMDSTRVRALVAAAFMTGDYFVRDSLAQFANQRRNLLSRIGNLDLDILLATINNDHDKALRAIREIARLEGGGFNSVLEAVFAMKVNLPGEGLAATERYDPTLEWRRGEAHAYWRIRARALHMLGEFEEELAEVRRGREVYPNRLDLLTEEVRALAALGQVGEVSGLLHEARALSDAPHPAAMVAGAELREHGFLKESKHAFNQAAEWLTSGRLGQELDSTERLHLAQALYGAERWAEAQDVSMGLMKEAPEKLSALGMVGLTWARLGDSAQAAEVIGRLFTMPQRNKPGEHLYLVASISAVLDQPDEAMSVLFGAFSEGSYHDLRLHQDMNFESLRERDDFRALVTPKG